MSWKRHTKINAATPGMDQKHETFFLLLQLQNNSMLQSPKNLQHQISMLGFWCTEHQPGLDEIGIIALMDLSQQMSLIL